MYAVPVASVQIVLVQNAPKRHLHPPTGRGLDISQRRRCRTRCKNCARGRVPGCTASASCFLPSVLLPSSSSLVLRYNAHISMMSRWGCAVESNSGLSYAVGRSVVLSRESAAQWSTAVWALALSRSAQNRRNEPSCGVHVALSPASPS
jgi:hypothetical protein